MGSYGYFSKNHRVLRHFRIDLYSFPSLVEKRGANVRDLQISKRIVYRSLPILLAPVFFRIDSMESQGCYCFANNYAMLLFIYRSYAKSTWD